ncbi:MAG: ribonuclease HII [Clostridiales bacterium]|jgi:ribonuclease HII|nr:ribonuclease HII [Clostridiales bacterium]HOA34133.1 ribonuclease HII [Clostridiales bacterium]HOJ35818.1 ribonuclease HII [Clostridiales bacterium]HOL78499.1 ribonuclease HII [Clostridiales bacterium]HPP67811.1 ribonuclease HII [Clostridiales bacterium]
MISLDIENSLRSEGYNIICGVDEAGRGPLAGPVFAAAVILPEDCPDIGINDSKKLTEKKRELLFDKITEIALDYSIAIVSEKEIDEINILNAAMLAMRKAVAGLKIKPDFVLIDGNRLPETGYPERYIVKGDSLSMSIAAASILAKVSRDRYMLSLDEQYPEYCFNKHKGYGTALHYQMLEKYGISPVHRRSFLKNLAKHNG